MQGVIRMSRRGVPCGAGSGGRAARAGPIVGETPAARNRRIGKPLRVATTGPILGQVLDAGSSRKVADYRRPAGLERADYAVSANLARTVDATRQAVIDTRCCLDWLESQGYRELGILGTSLGSCYAFIASAHDERLRVNAFNHASTYFADVVWTGQSTRHVREGMTPRRHRRCRGLSATSRARDARKPAQRSVAAGPSRHRGRSPRATRHKVGAAA